VKPWINYFETDVSSVKLTAEGSESVLASTQIGLNGGRLLSNWGSIGMGLYSRSGDAQPNIGDLSIAGTDWNSGAWAVNFGYDKLDSMTFPRRGALLSFNWINNRAKLGADLDQDRLRINGLWANTHRRDSLIFWTSMGGVVDGEPDNESGYTIGGLFSLSGYEKYDLKGRFATVTRLIYLRSLSNSRSVIKIPWYIGASVEAGNVWNETQDITFGSLIAAGSIFVGMDTPLGPLYLAQGFSEGRVRQLYLYFGRNFAFF